MKHNEDKIHRRGKHFGVIQEYLGELVYGGIDGSVTTFAVVAGAAGAHLSSSVVLILGFANLIADGFSMSVGSYLSSKAERDNYNKHKAIEYWEVEHIPEKEKDEIREIYQRYGFEGKLLEDVVAHIVSDKDRWVEVMMKEELELAPETKTPLGMGLATYISFLAFGFVPLVVYVFDYWTMAARSADDMFVVSSAVTLLVFLFIGYAKSQVTGTKRIQGMIETLLLGGAAAALSYIVGNWLEKFFA